VDDDRFAMFIFKWTMNNIRPWKKGLETSINIKTMMEFWPKNDELLKHYFVGLEIKNKKINVFQK
jgi:hypothetical protein